METELSECKRQLLRLKEAVSAPKCWHKGEQQRILVRSSKTSGLDTAVSTKGGKGGQEVIPFPLTGSKAAPFLTVIV